MVAQEEKELLISFSNTNSDVVISIYYENEKIKLVHANSNSFFWVNCLDDLKRIVTNIMETWCYDTSTYYYNLEYGESIVYDILDVEIR